MNTSQPSPTDPGWYPECYALRVSASRCSSCGETHYSSQLWLVYGHLTYTQAKRERALDSDSPLQRELPLVKFSQHLTQRACHLCVDNLATLGLLAPLTKVASESKWREALIASAKHKKAELLRSAKPARPSLSLDSIF